MQTRETADLFLQLIVEVLAKNGRAAVVLPDGTLFGEGVKTKIKSCLPKSAICIPSCVYRMVCLTYTGIKTNLLFYQRSANQRDLVL